MSLQRGIPAPTKAQKRRQDEAREVGCIVARMLGLGFVYGEIHHLTECGRTISQDHTVCLNPYSHRGVPFNGWSLAECRLLFGPSLAEGSKLFHAQYGANTALLEKQNWLLQVYHGAYA